MEHDPERSTLRVMQLEMELGEDERGWRRLACEAIGLPEERLLGMRWVRRSLDLRRRDGRRRFRLVGSVDLEVPAGHRSKVLQRALRSGKVREAPEPARLEVAGVGARSGAERALVLGAGPAGLFAALALARNGIPTTLVDRGPRIEDRGRRLVRFHRSRVPDPEGNLLFGEGGAGTYSDGKIYTRVDDELETTLLGELVECGADPAICYDSLAHIGTDRLHRILPKFRERLQSAGVEFLWDTRVDGLRIEESGGRRRVVGLHTNRGELGGTALFLASGHSARDTWRWLVRDGVPLVAKPFQLGVRIEHPQELIDRGRYGDDPRGVALGAASYQLVAKRQGSTPPSHTFCMCPGGRIVASVHAPGLLCTNGMSNSTHSSRWATSAIVTTFGPAEFGTGSFAGVEFQEQLEERFFEAGGGDFTAPAQTAADFRAGRRTAVPQRSTYTFGTTGARLDTLLPEKARDAIGAGLERFDRILPGFGGPEGLLVGLESRSSGPVRIPRDRDARHAEGFTNLYPLGEGAGYAGGIMSAALDGARSALAWLEART